MPIDNYVDKFNSSKDKIEKFFKSIINGNIVDAARIGDSAVRNAVNTVQSTIRTVNSLTNIDIRYIKPKYWKLDDYGNATNNWCRLYLTPPFNVGTIQKKTNLAGANALKEPFGDTNVFVDDVLLVGVSINLSKSPNIIEKHVKGFNIPVYETFNIGAFDIQIDFLESGPVFWQQNSIEIAKLVNILDSGMTINISSPQLELVYGINKVVCTGYSIDQDQRFYSHNNISISLKSDSPKDLIIRTANTFKIEDKTLTA